jgi:murein DD-endopeptidase MepM/ murein hydrolase activator NlpD
MMRILYRFIYITILLLSFTQATRVAAQEMSSIYVETPGLFDKSETFEVDFTQTRQAEYSFPLPVGKVVASSQQGLEIETTKGDAVKAMFEGTVRLSRNIHNFGNVVVVRHPNGFETVYANNAQNLVKVGDKVKAGQTVAIVGGHGERYYCLFSIIVNGNKVNPATLIDVNAHTLHKQIVTVKKVGNRVSITTRLTPEQKRQRAEKAQTVSLDTNDPFQGKHFYRLNLDMISEDPKAWHYPLEGSHVISGYGGKRRHAGVDIKNGPGTKIYAAFDGKVVQSGVFSGYGKCITIRHRNGLETRYSHNSKNHVTVGEMVKAGQVIGIVGRTGRATTEHVHFETRINGKAFDPSYVFDHAKHCLQKGTLQFKKNGGVSRITK